MEVGDRHLETGTINSKQVYFVTGDGGGIDIVALQGDRGPAGARGLNGDTGDRGPAGSRDSPSLKDTKVLQERLVK